MVQETASDFIPIILSKWKEVSIGVMSRQTRLILQCEFWWLISSSFNEATSRVQVDLVDQACVKNTHLGSDGCVLRIARSTSSVARLLRTVVLLSLPLKSWSVLLS